MNPSTRSVVAALLLAVPVTLQLAVDSFDDALWGHLLFAGTQLTGWALLATVCRGLGASMPPSTGAARVGSRLTVAGCVVQVLFATAYAVLTLTTGDPEGSFVAFLLGFLLLTVGGLVWGRALVRAGARRAGFGLLCVAVLGFLAMAVGQDPFHDIFLLGSFAAWVPVGQDHLAGPGAMADPGARSQTGGRSRSSVRVAAQGHHGREDHEPDGADESRGGQRARSGHHGNRHREGRDAQDAQPAREPLPGE